MASSADVFTIPRTRWISPGASDVWGIDFANELDEDETIAEVAARIMHTDSRSTIDEAVVDAEIDGDVATQINVSWVGTDLSPGIGYRLETIATLSSGADVPLYTDLIVL